jgi:hypothetical protein
MTMAPIALFVYKRPSHVRHVVEMLQKNKLAAESDFFIFSDGANTSKEASAVYEVRKYIRTITGFRSISIIEREKNWGLANSIIDGVTQLCDEYGRVIVLEDDLVVSMYFLEYMNAALCRYENESKVMQVSGHMFPIHLDVSEDTFFLPITTTWGWATWRRAWTRLDRNMENYEKLVNDKKMIHRFDIDGTWSCMKMLKSARAGKSDSWGICWYLSVFIDNGLVLFPAQSFVENKGFDVTGTNCGPSANGALLSQPTTIFRVCDFPAVVQCSEVAFEIVKKYLLSVRTGRGFLAKIMDRIIRVTQILH